MFRPAHSLTWLSQSRLVEYDEPVDQPISNSVLYKQESVLNAARANGWIGERFDEFTKSNTAGSAFLDTPDGIGFIAQSPRDDGFPFFAISLTQRFTEAYQYDADWESLVFVRPSELWDDHAEPMLGRDPFPHDYPDSFQPDFMILPVVLLRCQVEHITEELSKIKKKLVEQDLDLTTKKVKDLKMMKHSLSDCREHISSSIAGGRLRPNLWRTWRKRLRLLRGGSRARMRRTSIPLR